MIRSNIGEISQSNIEFPSLPPRRTISSILDFLELWLPSFLEIYPFSPTPDLEDNISKNLHLFLQGKAKINNLLFHFDAKKGVDFLIWIQPFNPGAEPLFLIEAKRLPPTNNKDYVQGRTGGIERFKREQTGFDTHLTIIAMLGYVQKNDFSYWLKRINSWIMVLIKQNDVADDIIWGKCDILKEIPTNSKHLARYVSTHARKTQMNIELHHFWLNMCN